MSAKPIPPRPPPAHAYSLLERFRIQYAKYELTVSFAIILVILTLQHLGYHQASKFTTLQYAVQQHHTTVYRVGSDDVYLICFGIVLFTFLRAFVMKHVLIPLARRVFNIQDDKKYTRFAEQGWASIYYLTFWSIGASLMWNSAYRFDLDHLWIGYPHRLMQWGMKAYYLAQLSFWFQQILVLHAEKPRKDHFVMFTHHIVTVWLMAGSYSLNATRGGNAVLVCMDFSDILLALAKTLNYIGLQAICDVLFALFVLSWLITRHILFPFIIYSFTFRAPYFNAVGDGPDQMPTYAYYIFTGLICCLEVLCMWWFWLILKVVTKVVRGKKAEDVRSSAEDSDDE